MSIRLPRLLDADGREAARLSPIRLSLHLKLTPLSTAEMELPHDAPAISVRDLIELYDENGSVGIFRVTEVVEHVGQTRLIRLEHSLSTLRDSMLGIFAFTGTVEDALTSLLTWQSDPRWQVGEVELPDDTTIIYATEYIDLLSALTLLLSMLPDGYALAFDQSGTDWLLHIRAPSNEDACEGRLHRNLQGVHYELDSSRLCTRVYPFGAEVETQRVTLIPMEGVDYLQSEAADTWGVISKTFHSDLIFDVPTLHDVAEAYLDLHTQPEATITVEAVDLHQATGEPLDSFQLGRMCRICLPEAGLTLRQRITAIVKPDVYGAPGQAVLTLRSRTVNTDEQTEIDDLVRQVTSGNLLGGTVTEVVSTNRAYGSYPSPVVHFFEIEDWAAVLDVRVTFKADSGASINALLVDGIELSVEERRSGSISAMPYLKRDELGQITQGQHRVTFHPSNGTYGENCGVSSTVTMTVIAKQTT